MEHENKYMHTTLVQKLKAKVLPNFDAVIADVAVLTKRWKIVDFTQI